MKKRRSTGARTEQIKKKAMVFAVVIDAAGTSKTQPHLLFFCFLLDRSRALDVCLEPPEGTASGWCLALELLLASGVSDQPREGEGGRSISRCCWVCCVVFQPAKKKKNEGGERSA